LPLEDWEIVLSKPDESFPDGIEVIPSGRSAVLLGPPTTAGTYNFHVALTLKGTMRLTYGVNSANPASSGLVRNGINIVPFSMLVKSFEPFYGNVDGNETLDLADLILLYQFVMGTDLEKANARDIMIRNDSMRNGNILSQYPADPSGADLTELARWFALDGRYVAWAPPSD